MGAKTDQIDNSQESSNNLAGSMCFVDVVDMDVEGMENDKKDWYSSCIAALGMT